MKRTSTNLIKEAFGMAKKKFVILSLPLSFFAVFSILVFIIGYLSPLSLLITIPFIVIPGFFAVSAINIVAANKNSHEAVGYFVMDRAYFSNFFRGGYRVIMGLLRTLLIYLVVSIIVTAILINTILVNDPEYIKFVEATKNIIDTNELINLFNEFLNNSQTFGFILFVNSLCSCTVAFYYFLHHISVEGIKYNYNFLIKAPLPMQDLNMVHRTTIRQVRGKFYKDYFGCTWFLALLFIIGMGGGTTLGYFFIPNADVTQDVVIGIFTAFVLLLFFVPYYLNAMNLLYIKYAPAYANSFVKLSLESLEHLKKTMNVDAEKEKQILDLIESSKPKTDDDKKDENK